MIEIFYKMLFVPLVAFFAIALGLLFKGLDRVLAARMQARIGPPLMQPFRDVRKLLLKENIVPAHAVRWLFNAMPLLALATSITLLLFIPLAGAAPILEGQGDLILLLYLLIFPSLALVIGGFASSSPYATVGAQREMVSMLSYEFPLAITAISIAWLLSTTKLCLSAFSLAVIGCNPIWGLVGPIGFVGAAILFIVLIAVMPAKLNAVPFDIAEAETEIAGGVLVEYSGRNLALFYLADAVKTIAFAAIVIALFLPYGIAATLGLTAFNAAIADAVFFLFKLFAVTFFGRIFVRIAMPRLRITQVVKAYWGYATVAALFGLLLIAIDVALARGGF